MTTNPDNDWNREDAVAAAEDTVRTLRAEVDRLKTDLTAAKTAQNAYGLSARETVESAREEAKRRGGGRTRSEQIAAGDAAATSTRTAENADAAFSAQSAADGRAEAARRAARR